MPKLPRRKTTWLAGLLLAVASATAYADCQADCAGQWIAYPRPDYWGGFEVGAATVSHSRGVHGQVDAPRLYFLAEIGVPAGLAWLTGVGVSWVELGKVPCDDPDNEFCGGQRSFDRYFLTVKYNPLESPWTVTTRLALSRYELLRGTDGPLLVRRRGLGGEIGIGYDWPPQGTRLTHYGLRTSVQYDWIPGSLSHFTLLAGLAISWY